MHNSVPEARMDSVHVPFCVASMEGRMSYIYGFAITYNGVIRWKRKGKGN